MTFDDILQQAIDLLRRRGRVSYGALKRQFDLDDEYLADLKVELIEVLEVATEKDGKMLVWTGEFGSPKETPAETTDALTAEAHVSAPAAQPERAVPAGERRQLTVMFCDLVGSTTLSEQLDPEEYHEVVSRYQETCTALIRRYAGHIAQHLGDGLLAYFSYPVAHEDDARRAVRASLEILAALSSLNARLPSGLKARLPHPIQVRIGVHTGVVVIGEIGSSEKREILAMGETPNIAARVQGMAEPDTVVMSAATHRLVQGLFECQDLGLQTLKGISTPLTLYRIVRESSAQSRFDVTMGTGLTPLVGREEELRVLQRRWTQARAGAGQVVLVSGEPGIGKSRLVQEIKEQVSAEGATRIEFRCSPYHQNSALYPIIDHLQRLLQFAQKDTIAVKLEKLQCTLSRYRFPQADTLPLVAALLSLPHPTGSLPLTVSPQKQKEKTLAAIVAWLVEEAEKATVLCAWEDLHWADPSTLEVLTLLLDQVPTMRLLAVLTFRPEFTPSWGNRSHLSQLTLSRLDRMQIETIVGKVTRENALPPEVVQQIVAKTDGVPLFVEELTKSVVEAVGAHGRASLQLLDIPATLHDSLMARLDRLAQVKEIAQLGATIGREFSYELLHAVSLADEETLQHGLKQLVEVELLYQHGLPPQATYLFKHALIQDTAYQSLLKSKRQQLHQQIAQVLETRFPETKETQPELLARHYTEAGLITQAVSYWQHAGERAAQRSAYVEAIAHLSKGLELLQSLPDTPERTPQELRLQLALAGSLIVTKGYTTPEVESVSTRALELCRKLGETPDLFWALLRLEMFYTVRAEHKTARELAEQGLSLAQSIQNPIFLVWAHFMVGATLLYSGKFIRAREHLDEGSVLYDPQQHRSYGSLLDPGESGLSYAAWGLWFLGYPDQALQISSRALTLAQELSHPYSLAHALNYAAVLHQLRREEQAAQKRAEASVALSTEQGFPHWLASGAIWRGWALAAQGEVEEGITQIRQGLAAVRAMGTELAGPTYLALLAEAYSKVGETEQGLTALCEALAQVEQTGERWYEAELHRLKGELLLAQEGYRPQAGGWREKTEEAEACFLQAIEVARKQHAKSLELRAIMSLVRLRRQQAALPESRITDHASRTALAEAYGMLSEVYNWFTEGFDTKDLQEAKALLEGLA